MTVSLQRVWGALFFALSMISSAPVFATVEYMHTDSLGSPVAVTDSDGNLLSTSEYEPFGKLLNGPLTDGPGYTGQVADAATGLSYMQQRYYDPSIGRFLSVDPVTADGNGGGFNRYAYANDNPYRFTDPDGRSPFDVQKKEAAGMVSDAGASAVEGFNPDRSNPGAHRNDTAKAYNKSIASQAKFNPRTALADIVVIENGPTKGNPVGHTAIAITGHGVYSSGNHTPSGISLAKYLASQGRRRNSTVYVLPTTPDQDERAFKVLQNNYRFGDIPKTFGNCSDRSNAALDAAGIADTPMLNVLPGSAGERAAAAGAEKILVPGPNP